MPPVTAHLHPSTPPLKRFLLSLLSPPPHPPLQRLLRPLLKPFLPKKTFIGHDLRGNSYWELHTRHLPTRPRRLVEYAEQQRDLGGYSVEDPAWHQWLRCTREEAPTIQELLGEVGRREELKVRVGRIDERERARREELGRREKRLFLGGEEGQGEKSASGDEKGEEKGGVKAQDEVADEKKEEKKKPAAEDPWAKAQAEREKAGENEGPKAWTPEAVTPRR
ncbi:hypothetical protein DFH27DRAFT_649057 [Peziza echinospora]|nr:hypothetical protein DFH27DRAFT_649057 [Peziza echinospora]